MLFIFNQNRRKSICQDALLLLETLSVRKGKFYKTKVRLQKLIFSEKSAIV